MTKQFVLYIAWKRYRPAPSADPSIRAKDGFLWNRFDSMVEDSFQEEFGITRTRLPVLEECVTPRIEQRANAIHEHKLSPRVKLSTLVRYCRNCK